jgi:regulator of sigma D
MHVSEEQRAANNKIIDEWFDKRKRPANPSIN